MIFRTTLVIVVINKMFLFCPRAPSSIITWDQKMFYNEKMKWGYYVRERQKIFDQYLPRFIIASDSLVMNAYPWLYSPIRLPTCYRPSKAVSGENTAWHTFSFLSAEAITRGKSPEHPLIAIVSWVESCLFVGITKEWVQLWNKFSSEQYFDDLYFDPTYVVGRIFA